MLSKDEILIITIMIASIALTGFHPAAATSMPVDNKNTDLIGISVRGADDSNRFDSLVISATVHYNYDSNRYGPDNPAYLPLFRASVQLTNSKEDNGSIFVDVIVDLFANNNLQNLSIAYLDIPQITLTNGKTVDFIKKDWNPVENESWSNPSEFYIPIYGHYTIPGQTLTPWAGIFIVSFFLFGMIISVLYVFNSDRLKFAYKKDPSGTVAKLAVTYGICSYMTAIITTDGKISVFSGVFALAFITGIALVVLHDAWANDDSVGDKPIRSVISEASDVPKKAFDAETGAAVRATIKPIKKLSPAEKMTQAYEALEECCKMTYRLEDMYCGVCGRAIEYSKLPARGK